MSRDMLELDIGKAILTAYNDGHLEAQFDSEGGQEAGAEQSEVLSPFGLDGRPRDPESADGIGATAMHGYEGRTQHMWLYGDPRCTASLPTLEKGSSRLYAHLDGDKVTWLRLDGATGSAKLRVPVGAGESTVEVDASTGDITLTHQGGTVIVVKAASVELGASAGGMPLALALPLIAWAATVETRFATLGQSGTPPAGVATTKVNGT